MNCKFDMVSGDGSGIEYMGEMKMAAGCVLLILGIFFGELRIKNRIETKDENFRKGIWGGRILLRRYHNEGALLNLGRNRRRAVAVVSVVMSLLLAVIFILTLGHRGSRLLRTGLAFLLGGAFSNTYDRLKRQYVVDYFSVNVKWKPLRRIVFNISDFCIMIGALLAALGV